MNHFSILILTLNEQRNLPACLARLRNCDDVVVLDSGSSDQTVEIARAHGARVLTHHFETFAQQRNTGLQIGGFKHRWVLHLDADEWLTPELETECEKIAADDPGDRDGFYIAPKMLFHDRWIPHCTDFPAYQARFGHAERFHFVQVGHGQREDPSMRMGTLQSSYFHNLSSQTDEELRTKHRHYAVQEARAFLDRAAKESPSWRSCFSRDRLVRRRALKAVSQRMPARGLLRFFYQYFLRRGFLDGSAGFSYCVLLARYESWISAEIRRQRSQT
jgi:glycosyltransferase involved in cell wall biosynthesis